MAKNDTARFAVSQLFYQSRLDSVDALRCRFTIQHFYFKNALINNWNTVLFIIAYLAENRNLLENAPSRGEAGWGLPKELEKSNYLNSLDESGLSRFFLISLSLPNILRSERESIFRSILSSVSLAVQIKSATCSSL